MKYTRWQRKAQLQGPSEGAWENFESLCRAADFSINWHCSNTNNNANNNSRQLMQ